MNEIILDILNNQDISIDIGSNRDIDLSIDGTGQGTTNYNALTNKPKINGVTLIGDKSSKDIKVQDAITNIEKVVAMIDRNVSSKILFCDLVNRIFLSV